MSKTQIDYSKTIIYKIEHIEDDNLVYVGHTTCWDKRKCKHKNACMNEKEKGYNYKLYRMIRDNGGWEEFRMLKVEKYPCNDKREAEKRENEVMKELKSTMNTNKSYISVEELKEHHKKYREIKKDRITDYVGKNKEKLQIYSKDYYKKKSDRKLKYQKEYNHKNKAHFQEYQEAYRENNKVKVLCECGCEVSKCHLKRHQSSKKHIDLIKNMI